MFGEVSPFYDLLNRLLSLGLDQGWRRRAVAELRLPPQGVLLDVATGTGDVAIEVLRSLGRCRVVGVDVSRPMLVRGGKKLPDAARCRFTLGRAEALPFADGSFDGATCAFGVRNFSPVVPCLAEMGRVVRPRARVVVLELTRPSSRLLRMLHGAYLRSVVPALGGAFGRLGAYRYLAASILAFPSPPEFLALMAEAGLADCRHIPLSGGVAGIFVGEARGT